MHPLTIKKYEDSENERPNPEKKMTYGGKMGATPGESDVKEDMAQVINLQNALEARAQRRESRVKIARKIATISLVIFSLLQLSLKQCAGPDQSQVKQGRLIHKLRKAPQRLLEGNTVEQEDLLLIRGIGPSTAGHWIRIREYLGSFPDTLHLRLVPGIGINRLQQIESQLIVKRK